MKEKIKKWATINVAFAVIYAISAVHMFCVDNYVVCAFCLCLTLCFVGYELKGRKIESLNELLEQSRKKEAEAIKFYKKQHKTILYKTALVSLYSSRLYLANTKVAFCKREIDTKTFLKELKDWEDCVEICQELVAKRKEELRV